MFDMDIKIRGIWWKGTLMSSVFFVYGVGILTYLSSTSECEGKHFSYLIHVYEEIIMKSLIMNS